MWWPAWLELCFKTNLNKMGIPEVTLYWFWAPSPAWLEQCEFCTSVSVTAVGLLQKTDNLVMPCSFLGADITMFVNTILWHTFLGCWAGCWTHEYTCVTHPTRVKWAGWKGFVQALIYRLFSTLGYKSFSPIGADTTGVWDHRILHSVVLL